MRCVPIKISYHKCACGLYSRDRGALSVDLPLSQGCGLSFFLRLDPLEHVCGRCVDTARSERIQQLSRYNFFLGNF